MISTDNQIPDEYLTEFMNRLRYAQEQQNAFFKGVREHFENHKVEFDYRIGPLGVNSSVIARVSEPPMPQRWNQVLRSLLNDYRSALDAYAFTLATIFNGGSLTPEEESSVYFPLATTEAKWNAMLNKKNSWLAKLPWWMLERVRATQPFLLPDTNNSLLLWLHETDIHGKHRFGIHLRTAIDPQMPHIFFSVDASGREIQINPLNYHQKNIGQAVKDGLEVFDLGLPQRATRVYSDHKPFLALWIERNGEVADLQDFLWAVAIKLQTLFGRTFDETYKVESEAYHNLTQLPGLYKKRWSRDLDDSGTPIHLRVRLDSGDSEPLSFIGRNDDDLLELVNGAVDAWEKAHGQQLLFFGYKGEVDFLNLYYPNTSHQPVDGTLRVRCIEGTKVQDVRRLFGADLSSDPAVLEAEFNTGRGGGGIVDIVRESRLVSQILFRDFRRFESGRSGIEYITSKFREAPFKKVSEWQESGELSAELRGYVRSYLEWDSVDVARLFDMWQEDDPRRLLWQSGFISTEDGEHWLRVAEDDPRAFTHANPSPDEGADSNGSAPHHPEAKEG